MTARLTGALHWTARLALLALRPLTESVEMREPQRDLPPGGPIPTVPFEGHCLQDLEGPPWPSVHGDVSKAIPKAGQKPVFQP